MNREQLRAELDSMQIEFSSKDSVVELMEMVRRGREVSGLSRPRGTKSLTSGLTQLKKKELQDRCVELAIPQTGNENRAQLIMKIKGHYAMATDPLGSDECDFGRYQGQTYRQIREHYPSYCGRVLQTSMEDECHPSLTRLAMYLRRPMSPPPVPVADEKAPKDVKVEVGSSSSSRGTAKAKAPPPPLPTEVLIKELQEDLNKVRAELRKQKEAPSAAAPSMSVDMSNRVEDPVPAVLAGIMDRLVKMEERMERQSPPSEASWTIPKDTPVPKDETKL